MEQPAPRALRGPLLGAPPASRPPDVARQHASPEPHSATHSAHPFAHPAPTNPQVSESTPDAVQVQQILSSMFDKARRMLHRRLAARSSHVPPAACLLRKPPASL